MIRVLILVSFSDNLVIGPGWCNLIYICFFELVIVACTVHAFICIVVHHTDSFCSISMLLTGRQSNERNQYQVIKS
jgi:hypothetical protein